MCWQCDHPAASSADYLKELRKTITKCKWAVQYVEDEKKPFAYTIGLHKRGFAEYVVTGVSPEHAMRLLNTVANYTIRKVAPKAGELMTIGGEERLEFVKVDQPDAHLNFAIAMYGPQVEALQVVWLDERGHSPWCPSFNGGSGSQPVLGKRGPQKA